MTTTLNKAVPALPSSDLKRTADFYAGVLGFRVVLEQEDFLAVMRDDVRLHFWPCTEQIVMDNSGCYIYVTGIDELYKAAEGHIHPNGPLTEKGYGMRDFGVLDPDGNLITFGEPVT